MPEWQGYRYYASTITKFKQGAHALLSEQIMLKRCPWLVAILFVLTLSACGGGGQTDTVANSSAVTPTQTQAQGFSASQSNTSSNTSVDSSSASATSQEKLHDGLRKGLLQARFNGPAGIAFDTEGNLYVADSLNYTIRKISTDGAVMPLAGTPGERGTTDGTGAQARFFDLRGLAVDRFGCVYVTDGNVVRKITPAGEVTTLAGAQGAFGNVDGSARTARFAGPAGIAVDVDGNVYVADNSNQTIRKISVDGVVSTLAGGNSINSTMIAVDGVGAAARFMGPSGLTIDSTGTLYVTDIAGTTASILVMGSTLIRKIDRITGAVVTVAGNLGLAYTPSVPAGTPVAEFESAFGIAVDKSGNIFVADHFNGGNRIRKVTSSREISTVAEDYSRFGALFGLALAPKDNLFTSDLFKHVIVRITQAGKFRVVAGKLGEPGSVNVSPGNERLWDD